MAAVAIIVAPIVAAVVTAVIAPIVAPIVAIPVIVAVAIIGMAVVPVARVGFGGQRGKRAGADQRGQCQFLEQEHQSSPYWSLGSD